MPQQIKNIKEIAGFPLYKTRVIKELIKRN